MWPPVARWRHSHNEEGSSVEHWRPRSLTEQSEKTMPKPGLIISPTQTSCAIFAGKSPPNFTIHLHQFWFPAKWVSINQPCETKALFFQVFFSSLPQRCGLSITQKDSGRTPNEMQLFSKTTEDRKDFQVLKNFPNKTKKKEIKTKRNMSPFYL